MKIGQVLRSECRYKLISADIPSVLRKLENIPIQVREIEFIDPLTVHLSVSGNDASSMESTCAGISAELHLLRKTGPGEFLKTLRKRPVLVICMIWILILSVFLPSRILFIRVEGNCISSTKKILEIARGEGVYFGASRKAVRSERVKNALLEKLDTLDWVGVNTNGMVTVISVKETNQSDRVEVQWPIQSLIASADGVITHITSTQGTVLCVKDQVVTKGQVLISGYEDMGLVVRAGQAKGEIYANTNRKIVAVSPLPSQNRGKICGTKIRYNLIIGKKQIKLFKDSGISDTGCGKLYTKKTILLPGGFSLPITFIREEIITYEETVPTCVEDISPKLSQIAEMYLLDEMIAGKVLHRTRSYMAAEEGLVFEGNYICSEMIARTKNEEIIDYDR